MNALKEHQINLFIDTSIYVGARFNFTSSLLDFSSIQLGKTKLRLIYPEITSDEVDRHIEKASNDCSNALWKAMNFPVAKSLLASHGLSASNKFDIDSLIQKRYRSELVKYHSKFQLVPLPSSTVNLAEVLEWRRNLIPPFSEKKEKEYPDAFALSSILDHIRKTKETVAIVSTDGDLQKASEHHDGLFYYKSLADYIENQLEDGRAKNQLKEYLSSDKELEAMIVDKLRQSTFNVVRGHDGGPIGIKVIEYNNKDISILRVDNDSAKAAFDFIVTAESVSTYVDLHPGHHDADGVPVPYNVSLHLTNELRISGTCEISMGMSSEAGFRVLSATIDQKSFTLY